MEVIIINTSSHVIEMENKCNKILAICLCMKQLLATIKLIQKKIHSNVDVTNVLGTKFGEEAGFYSIHWFFE